MAAITKEEILAKADLQRQECFAMLASIGLSEEDCYRYCNRLMHRLLLTGWHLGKEVGAEKIKEHLAGMRAIEDDPKTHQMKAMQAREPAPVANEGGGGVTWDADRGGGRR